MKSFTRRTVLLAMSFAFILATQNSSGSSAAPQLPNPILVFTGPEYAVVGGKEVTRYTFDVFNKDAYPADFFAASPNLPPCGTNTKAARTWVDIYDQSGKKLNSFCALTKPADLGKIWFGLERDKVPPSWVYIELNDRQTTTKYKSNLAETVE